MRNILATSEVRGSLDELNSFLGMVKVTGKSGNCSLEDIPFEKIIEGAQTDIFTISESFVDESKEFEKERVEKIEKYISSVEKELPVIAAPIIPGGCELAALLDFARTLALKAERQVSSLIEGGRQVQKEALDYLNQLPILLFALARLSNHRSGIKESAPKV